MNLSPKMERELALLADTIAERHDWTNPTECGWLHCGDQQLPHATLDALERRGIALEYRRAYHTDYEVRLAGIHHP